MKELTHSFWLLYSPVGSEDVPVLSVRFWHTPGKPAGPTSAERRQRNGAGLSARKYGGEGQWRGATNSELQGALLLSLQPMLPFYDFFNDLSVPRSSWLRIITWTENHVKGGKRSWPDLKYCFCICVEEEREITLKMSECLPMFEQRTCIWYL